MSVKKLNGVIYNDNMTSAEVEKAPYEIKILKNNIEKVIGFNTYKEGCEWLKNNYKDYIIINLNGFKSYVLKLVREEMFK